MFNIETLSIWAEQWLPALLDAAVKGTVLLGFATLAAAVLRKRSAAIRQLVWVLALGILLVLPLVSQALPAWQVLPTWARWRTPKPLVNQTIGEPREEANQRMELSELPLEFTPPTETNTLESPAIAKTPIDVEPIESPEPQVATTPEISQAEPSSPAPAPPVAGVLFWLTLAWAVGLIVCLLPLVLGRISLWRLARGAQRLDGPWGQLIRKASRALGMHSRPLLLMSHRQPMPMVWGVFRPKLLLPAEASNWSADRRWVVLLHELAHAKRRDCLAKLIAHVACGVYWFNPLCWMAFKQMQREAEVACDDLVVTAGHRPSDYAQHLLEIASGLNSGVLAAYSSIALARPSEIEGRLLSILDPKRCRRRMTARGLLIAALLMTAIALPLSIMQAAANDNKPATDSVVDEKADTQPGEDNQSKRVAELIGQLGGSKYSQREAAQDELVKIGQPAVKALRAAGGDRNLERSNRAKTALEEIYDRTFGKPVVSGRVLDKPGGKGVTGATVRLYNRWTCQLKKTKTDEDGNYTFTGIGPGPHTLHLIDRPAGVWTEGALIYVTDGPQRYPAGKTRLTPKPQGGGSSVLVDIGPASPGVARRKDDDWVEATVIGAPGVGQRSPDLHLKLPQSVSGTVRDDKTGKPAVGAGVSFASSLRGGIEVSTDEKGRYKLYTRPRSIQIVSQCTPGRYYPSQKHRTVTVTTGAHFRNADLTVVSATSLTGRVLFPDGLKAPKGTKIHAALSWRDTRGKLVNGKRMMPMVGGMIYNSTEVQTSSTDAEGNFTVYLRSPYGRSALSDQEVIVTVLAWLPDGSLGGMVRTKALDSRKRPGDPVKVILQKTGSVAFQIRGQGAEPVTNAKVTIWGSPREAKHSGQGHYRADGLIPGFAYRLYAEAPGYRDDNSYDRKAVAVKPAQHVEAPAIDLAWSDKRAVPQLIEQAPRGHKGQGDQGSIHALGKIGPDAAEAVPTLTKLLMESKDEEVRRLAAQALGRIGPASRPAVSSLIKAMQAETPKVAGYALEALGRIGDSAAVSPIKAGLKTGHRLNPRTAATALWRIRAAARPASGGGTAPTTQPAEKWGKTINGLRARVVSEQDYWICGQSPRMRFEVQNVSKDDIRLRPMFDRGYVNVRFHVRTVGQPGPVRVWPGIKRTGVTPPEPITLKPGQSISTHISSGSTPPGAGNGKDWELTATLQSPSLPVKDGQDIWRGQIEAVGKIRWHDVIKLSDKTLISFLRTDYPVHPSVRSELTRRWKLPLPIQARPIHHSRAIRSPNGKYVLFFKSQGFDGFSVPNTRGSHLVLVRSDGKVIWSKSIRFAEWPSVGDSGTVAVQEWMETPVVIQVKLIDLKGRIIGTYKVEPTAQERAKRGPNNRRQPDFSLITSQAFGPGDKRFYFSTRNAWDNPRIICIERGVKLLWNKGMTELRANGPGNLLRISADGKYVAIADTTTSPSSGFAVYSTDGRKVLAGALPEVLTGTDIQFAFRGSRLTVTGPYGLRRYNLASKPTGSWGKSVQGLNARLRPDKTVWAHRETPTFRADVRNTRPTTIGVPTSQTKLELHIDGRKYRWAIDSRRALIELAGRSEHLNIPLSANRSWSGASDAKQLRLKPGKHTARVTVTCKSLDGKTDILLTSNTVAFEIRAETASSAQKPKIKPLNAERARAALKVILALPAEPRETSGRTIRVNPGTVISSTRDLLGNIHADRTEEIDQVLFEQFGTLVIDSRGDPDPVFRGDQVILQTWRAALTKATDKQAEIKAFLAGGPVVAEACHRALAGLKIDNLATARLAYLLGEVGRPESMPILIDLLGKSEQIVLARMGPPANGRPRWRGWDSGDKGRECTVAAMTMRALWRLSGRRFWQRTADWSKWWKVVKTDFIVADQRPRRTVTDAQVDALTTALSGKDASNARERLLCLGPGAAGRLMKLLADAKGEDRYHLLWLLDEFGALEEAPPHARYEYFIRRFSTEKHFGPIARQLHERALLTQSFADYCRTALAVNHRLRLPVWSKRVASKIAGYKIADLKLATGVLTKAINNRNIRVRYSGVYIVMTLGRINPTAPDDLLKVMIDRWRTEPNAPLRYAVLEALGNYRTVAVEEAIRDGLGGDRLDLLGDCARLPRDVKWILDKGQPRTRRRFVELTHHKSPKIREYTTDTLNERAPELLADELERLSQDVSDTIRGNCAPAIVQLKDAKYLPILVRLMNDPTERVREYAFQAVTHEPYRRLVSPGDMLGVLSTTYQWNKAIGLIAQRGGPEAVITLLEGGRKHGSFKPNFPRSLKKITGRQFDSPQALETWWWQFEINMPVPASVDLDTAKLKSLWSKLTARASVQAYRAMVAMAGGGNGAVEFVAKRVRPVSADAAGIATLIKQLDSDKYAVRKNASAELFRVGPTARAALRAAANGKLDAESRAQVGKLLEACDRPYPVLPEAMRVARAIRVLELIATPQAVVVLKKLAKGTPKAQATNRAQAALKRMADSPTTTQPTKSATK
jgi:beta-lactamase regulating signal transducer with metallopeptidase domain/HEAT repeat protein